MRQAAVRERGRSRPVSFPHLTQPRVCDTLIVGYGALISRDPSLTHRRETVIIKGNDPNEREERRYKLLKLGSISLLLLVVVLVITNLSVFSGLLKELASICSSIFYGVLFAFLLNPLVRFVDKLLRRLLCRLFRERVGSRISRVLGLLFAFSFAGFAIYLMIHNIAPRVGESIEDIVARLPSYYDSVERWVMDLLEDPDIRSIADTIMEKVYGFLDDFVNNDLLGSAQHLIIGLTTSVYAVVREVINMLIGLVVSVYILLSKDTFLAQSKKLIVALFQPDTADRVMEHGRKINKIFNGFIIGKIIDSIIIGILCYIGVAFLKMPYPELLAIIVGVTNVIPYFGPILGAVPCALLVLMVDPMKCLYFLIFVVILQQVDGNIIGPRILGENVGISSFWILVSITIGGGLFGFVGMLLGVPVFAVLYMLIGDALDRTLAKKDRSIATRDYYSIRSVQDLPRRTRPVPASELPEQEAAEPESGQKSIEEEQSHV